MATPKLGEAAASPSTKTTGTGKAKANKPRSMMAIAEAAVAARGEISWADRLREFQIDVPASTAYSELASNSDEEAGAGRGGANVGAEQHVVKAQQVEEEGDPSTWDGVGVEPEMIIENKRQFDVRCKAYEV